MPDEVVGWSFEKVTLTKTGKDGKVVSKEFDNVPVHATMTPGGKPKVTVFGVLNPKMIGNMDSLVATMTKKLGATGKKKTITKLRRKAVK